MMFILSFYNRILNQILKDFFKNNLRKLELNL